ncbi:unnamed protein product [Schistocephalus solidus]|uniref:Secreted protein n=1 Tax=Schistocephalus solidus TaxID=70667 RepID=A0A183SJQ5_SCHSO|nr:unnamed protein product [Schistocephalus solidus]
MLLWPPLAFTQLSSVAPRSGHTPGNRHDQRAKPAHFTLPSYFSSLSSVPSFLLSLLSFTLNSTPPLLPLSSPFPPHPRSKKFYGEVDMQSRRRPKRIGRSPTNRNRDP